MIRDTLLNSFNKYLLGPSLPDTDLNMALNLFSMNSCNEVVCQDLLSLFGKDFRIQCYDHSLLLVT